MDSTPADSHGSNVSDDDGGPSVDADVLDIYCAEPSLARFCTSADPTPYSLP